MISGIRCSCNIFFNTYRPKVTLFLKNLKPYSTNFDLSPREHHSEKIVKVAIVGVPNAGKSTLINNLIDRKICPTSNKAHTTLVKTSAIHNVGDTQIVFLDTPGLTSPNERKRYKLSEKMIKDIKVSLKNADIIGVIQDVGSPYATNFIHTGLKDLLNHYDEIPSFLILNKVDLLKSKRKLLDIIKNLCNNTIAGSPISKISKETWTKGYDKFSDVFMISALESDGLASILEYLIKNAKPGPWLYSPQEWKEKSDEDLTKDMIRAKFLDFLPQEIPYGLQIQLEHFENEPQQLSCIATIYCPTKRILNLIAGAGNGKLQQISDSTRFDLVNTFKKSVTLTFSLQAHSDK